MTDQPDVAIALVVDDNGVSGGNRLTTLHLTWRGDDPLAVSLRLTAEPDHPALPRGRWSMLRDFLRYGLDHPTGDGDVRARPDQGRRRITLELREAGRVHTVSADMAQIANFLDRTDAIVPAGEERSDLALDDLIDRLLRA